MKSQIFFCISTFAVFLSSVECQYPGQYPAPGQFQAYDIQSLGGGGYGGDYQSVDPVLAIRLKNLKKLSKLSIGLDQGLSKALALKSKCSKLLSQQLKNSLLPQELSFPGLSPTGMPCQSQLLNYPPQLLSSQPQGLNIPQQPLSQPQGFNIPPQLLAQAQGLSIPPQYSNQQGLPPQFLQPQVLNLPQQFCDPQPDTCPAGQVQFQQVSPQDYQIPLELLQRMSSDPISSRQSLTHRVINVSGPCPHGFPQDAQQYGSPIAFPPTSQSTPSEGRPQVMEYGQPDYGQPEYGQPQYGGQSNYDQSEYGQFQTQQPPQAQNSPVQFPGRSSYQPEGYYE